MSSTTVIQSETPLRKRMRVLERAHQPLSGLGPSEVNILPLEMKHKNISTEDTSPSSPEDYDSHTESSDDGERVTEGEGEEEGGKSNDHGRRDEQRRPVRPTIDTTDTQHRRHGSQKDHSPMSPSSRAWYEFDLAVVVALVSPIGNWLTGGDHVKNLLLIVFLIFYLHQIIEVPWDLYQKSRPRHRPYHIPPLENPASPEARYSQLAASELQKLELFFLFMTVLSPLLGAALLRYATAAILGPDAVSWFSTGLFVLATGVRPWAHLIDRLSKRTTELHDFVHYPSPTHPASEEQHKQLEHRVAQLEKALSKVKSKVVHSTEDVYEYVDDAVDAVEHAMRKQERKWDKYEGKVKEVEQVVGQLRSVGVKKDSNSLCTSISADIGAVKACLRSVIEYIVPAWLLTLPHKYGSVNSSVTALGVKMPMRPSSGASSPSKCSTPLETIIEEDYVKTNQYPILAKPYSITSTLVYRVGYLVTLPLRAVARMILRNY